MVLYGFTANYQGTPNLPASLGAVAVDPHLVANLGSDWWLNTSAPFSVVNGVDVNNPGVGESNWVSVTNQWQTLYCYSLSGAQLQADPPPPLE
jgi:hypothetical protein